MLAVAISIALLGTFFAARTTPDLPTVAVTTSSDRPADERVEPADGQGDAEDDADTDDVATGGPFPPAELRPAAGRRAFWRAHAQPPDVGIVPDVPPPRRAG